MSDDSTQLTSYSTPEFFLNTPLYQKLYFPVNPIGSLQAIQAVWNLVEFKRPLDAYCVDCKNDSVFQHQETLTPDHIAPDINKNRSIPPFGDYRWEFVCSRCSTGSLVYIARLVQKSSLSTAGDYEIIKSYYVEKYGQSPSLADLAIPGVAQYRKLLPKQYSELTMAIGLNAHGIGIGSFVYLRRIFEQLLEEAHSSAKSDSGWNEEDYQGKRWIDKITLLKHKLPAILVNNAVAYSILSKGLHELTEKDCKVMFPIILDVIKLILNAKLAEKERLRLEKETTDALAKMNQQLK